MTAKYPKRTILILCSVGFAAGIAGVSLFSIFCTSCGEHIPETGADDGEQSGQLAGSPDPTKTRPELVPTTAEQMQELIGDLNENGFCPDAPMTRGALVQALYLVFHSPSLGLDDPEAPFEDVPLDSPYALAAQSLCGDQEVMQWPGEGNADGSEENVLTVRGLYGNAASYRLPLHKEGDRTRITLQTERVNLFSIFIWRSA